MKWTLTSPDGIGDFLLRLPWLFEMERRGWRLQLVAREPTLEIARLAGLAGDFVPLRLSPYSKEAKSKREPFADILDKVRAFCPALVFFGPSHLTMLEEEAVENLRDYRIGGFVFDAEFWPSECIADPHELVQAFALRVKVRTDDSEPVRNARAAEVLLGSPVRLDPFFLDPDRLPGLPPEASGLVPGSFLVVNAGYRSGDYFKGWGWQNWSRELSLLEFKTDKSFIFVGGQGELESHAAILSALGNPARHLDLTGKIGSLGELARLLHCSAAYVGKDSGVMHLASSLQRSVLSVFGGGHWKRFLPTGTRAVVLTVKVACRGCDWRCHLLEPLCVRDLEKGSLVRAWERLGGLQGVETVVREQTPTPEAQKILLSQPHGSFSTNAHLARKRDLRKEREESMLPLPLRLWRRFLSLKN